MKRSIISVLLGAGLAAAAMPTIYTPSDRYRDGKQSKPNYQRFNKHKLRKK